MAKRKGGLGIDIARAAKNRKVQKRMEKKAREVQEYWRSISPVFGDRPPKRDAPMFGYPGFYRDSVQLKKIEGKGGAAKWRVFDKDRKASWIEYGSKHMPEYAPKAKTKARFSK